MIDHTKAKSNRELLEAATSFKFPGYKYFDERSGKYCSLTLHINEMSRDDKTFWVINGAAGTYDNVEKRFSYYYELTVPENARFYDIYEALETVRGILK